MEEESEKEVIEELKPTKKKKR